MIIPCMNSTSARDIGGRDAWVSAGRVFVGSPGAPGCTTDGPPLAFWAPATGETGSRITAAVTTPAPRRQARQIVLVAGKPLISVLLRYHALRTTEQRDLLPLPRTAILPARKACLCAKEGLASPTYFGLVFYRRSGYLRGMHRILCADIVLSTRRGLRRVLNGLTHMQKAHLNGGLFVEALSARRFFKNYDQPHFGSSPPEDINCRLQKIQSHPHRFVSGRTYGPWAVDLTKYQELGLRSSRSGK